MLSHNVSLRTQLLTGALFGVLLFFGIGSAGARAVEAPSDAREEITLSPAQTRITADPGQIQTGTFTVVNTGESAFEFIVYARPYSVETQAYTPNYADTPERSNVHRWVQFDTTRGSLEPGEEQEIDYSIVIPDDAEAGGHYGVLFAETVPAEDAQQVVVRNKRVGSIVRLSVSGDISREGSVSEQSIPWLQFRAPVASTALVTNTGNVDFDATATMRAKTLLGREVFTSTAPYVVYPDKPRRLTLGWDGPALLGVYQVEQSVEVLDETSTTSGYVLIMPRWLLILLVMAVLAGGAYVAYRRQR